MTHDNVTDIVERLRRRAKEDDEAWARKGWAEAADVVEAQQADLATLRKQLENAREALRQIADPIGYAQKRADAEGMKIDGQMAVRLSSDAEYLKGIARKELENYHE